MWFNLENGEASVVERLYERVFVVCVLASLFLRKPATGLRHGDEHLGVEHRSDHELRILRVFTFCLRCVGGGQA